MPYKEEDYVHMINIKMKSQGRIETKGSQRNRLFCLKF